MTLRDMLEGWLVEHGDVKITNAWDGVDDETACKCDASCIGEECYALDIIECRIDVKHRNIPVKSVLQDCLRSHGADGLYCLDECLREEGCGCEISDLAPCENGLDLDQCVASKIAGFRSFDGNPFCVPMTTSELLWNRYQKTGSYRDMCRWLKQLAYCKNFEEE